MACFSGRSYLALLLLAAGLLVGQAVCAEPPARGQKQLPVSRRSAVEVEAKRGKQLFSKLDCFQCHSIHGQGGCLSPQLDDVGARRSKEYLKLRLLKGGEIPFEKLLGHEELLPHPRVDAAAAKDLVAYLSTLKTKAAVATTPHVLKIVQDIAPANWSPAASSPSSVEGRRLLLESGCMYCHSIGSQGSNNAPALDGVGGRHSREYLSKHISNPRHKVGKNFVKMPQFDFLPNQVNSIVDFLETLPSSDKSQR